MERIGYNCFRTQYIQLKHVYELILMWQWDQILYFQPICNHIQYKVPCVCVCSQHFWVNAGWVPHSSAAQQGWWLHITIYQSGINNYDCGVECLLQQGIDWLKGWALCQFSLVFPVLSFALSLVSPSRWCGHLFNLMAVLSVLIETYWSQASRHFCCYLDVHK